MTVSYSNIEPSGFHKGRYIGYAAGPWHIVRAYNNVWRATRQRMPWATLEAHTLVKMSAKLKAWEAEYVAERKPK